MMRHFFNPDWNVVLNPQEDYDSEPVPHYDLCFRIDEQFFNNLFVPLYEKFLRGEVKVEEPDPQQSVRAEDPMSQDSGINERYTGPNFNLDYLLGSIQLNKS